MKDAGVCIYRIYEHGRQVRFWLFLHSGDSDRGRESAEM